MQPEGRPQQGKLTTWNKKGIHATGTDPRGLGIVQPWGGRSQLEVELERCHLMKLRTKERWCSRLGGLREPILTSPQAQGPREARRRWRLLTGHLHPCQGCRTPGLLCLCDAPHEVLVRVSRVRQAVRHANVAVGWASAVPHLRGPEVLQRGDSVEPWYVDADAQPTILAWMGSHCW